MDHPLDLWTSSPHGLFPAAPAGCVRGGADGPYTIDRSSSVQSSPVQSGLPSITVALHAWPSALIAGAYDPPVADSGQATMCPTLQNFYIEMGAASIREMYYLRQPGTDQDKHIRYVKSGRFQKRVEVLSKGM
jgi:hypothetical protein